MVGLPDPFFSGYSVSSYLQLLIVSPAAQFFLLADVENEQCHKDDKNGASSDDAEDEIDIQTFPCTADVGYTGFHTDFVFCLAGE